ncbi:MAG: anaerobic sulfatase maturase [Armatimonadetes bacterium]|nr:anaerobic sulfatase maturase [Armatimonadota bacterium]
MVKPFSLLIKPAGADCNLRCRYCFYLDRAELYSETHKHRMSDPVLERVIAGYMGTIQTVYAFGWQGGEPSLMGLEFFRKVVDMQQRYGRPGAIVTNGLQTNATLMNDDLAAHLAKYRFLVGVSLDGPPGINDLNRHTVSGRSVHTKTLEGITALRRQGVSFNVLTVVSSANVKQGKEVYRYIKSLGLDYHQYIPCVEFDATGRPLPFTITGDQWGEFLKEVFDEWRRHDVGRVSIRLHDDILNRLITGAAATCTMRNRCNDYFVVEHNGDVYPCDFFVRPDLKLGSLMQNTWEEMQTSTVYQQFGRMKSEWNLQCDTCEYRAFCAGDCLKHRFRQTDDPHRLSWLCAGWKRFYRHSLPIFQELAWEASRRYVRQ